MRENEYQVIYRFKEEHRYIENVTELKAEGGAYLFYRGDVVYYSVPVDCVEEINVLP